MTIITAKPASNFVSQAKFPKAPVRRRTRGMAAEPPLQLKASEAQTMVVGAGLVVAAEKVPVQVREDLINCTLFAQLAASGEVEDPTEVNAWYDAYFRALTALGWAQSDTQFETYEFDSVNAEANKAIITVLTALLGPQAAALAVLKTALEGLQSMQENAPWIALSTSKAAQSARLASRSPPHRSTTVACCRRRWWLSI